MGGSEAVRRVAVTKRATPARKSGSQEPGGSPHRKERASEANALLATAATRESAEQLRLIIENAREYAIFSLDLGRRITSWNSGARNILGYTHEEALGQSGDMIFTSEECAAGDPEQEADTALNGGRAADERWHVRKDGSRFRGSGIMMAMRDARQEAIGFVKIFRDQTRELHATRALEQSRVELKEALCKTEQARQAAEAASKAKNHFVAVLSHELRTPLTPVTIALCTLLRRKDLPPPVQRAHEMILRNVQLEAHFIDDLLDLTRIERGRMEIVRASMDIHEAVERAIEISSPDIEAKHQKLGVVLDAADRRVNGDFARLPAPAFLQRSRQGRDRSHGHWHQHGSGRGRTDFQSL